MQFLVGVVIGALGAACAWIVFVVIWRDLHDKR
jgi:hypothetical protein